MASPAPVNGDVTFLGTGNYTGADLRKGFSDVAGVGATTRGSFRVSPSAGLTVNVATGAAYIRQPGDGTLYRATQENSALQITLDTPAVSGNPRVDQLVLHIYDGSAPGDVSNQYLGAVEVITGAQAASANLDNRNGAPDPRSSFSTSQAFIPLADIVVAAGATTIGAAQIRDRRPFGVQMMPTLTAADVDMVDMVYTPGVAIGRHTVSGLDYASHQSAVLSYLPHRLTATKLRWAYWQDPTNPAPVGINWRFVICDASGRLVGDTGSVAFGGSANTIQRQIANLSVPYAGYVFEPGVYITWFAIGTLGSTSTVHYVGTSIGTGTNDLGTPGFTVPAPNHAWGLTTGGVTFPATNTMLAMQDLGTGGVNIPWLPVPVCALSSA